jgi:hypothetical protein
MHSLEQISDQSPGFQPVKARHSVTGLPGNETTIMRFLAASAYYFDLPVNLVTRQYRKYRCLNLLGRDLSC